MEKIDVTKVHERKTQNKQLQWKKEIARDCCHWRRCCRTSVVQNKSEWIKSNERHAPSVHWANTEERHEQAREWRHDFFFHSRSFEWQYFKTVMWVTTLHHCFIQTVDCKFFSLRFFFRFFFVNFLRSSFVVYSCFWPSDQTVISHSLTTMTFHFDSRFTLFSMFAALLFLTFKECTQHSSSSLVSLLLTLCSSSNQRDTENLIKWSKYSYAV